MNKTTHTALSIALLLLATAEACPQSSNQNYIVTHTYTSPTAYNDVIHYYDGLGRPVQTVRKQFTPNGKDLVIRQEYDSFGRESKAWLPVSNNSSSGAFDSATGVASAYGNDSYAYSEILYEPSPLNRVSEAFGPGQAWRSSNRRVKTEYLANRLPSSDPALACIHYHRNDLFHFSRNGYYAAGSLYVTKTTDEDNNVSYEFRDKRGQVLLQRQINGGERYDTYYVYDDLGNLGLVFPPLIAEQFTQDRTYGFFDSDVSVAIEKQAYVYYYDHRNRITTKKPPYTYENCVYDTADRLVFIQLSTIDDPENDPNIGRGWLFHKYDALGRTILTGMYNGDKGSSDNENVRGDNMQNQWQNQLSRESRNDSQACGYTWNTFPTDPNSVTVTQVNYYDDYSYANSSLSQLDYQTKTGYDAQHSSAKGLLTGTRNRLLTAGAGGNEWITSVYYYDYKGNVVQKRSTNQLGGYDCEYYAYGYNNQLKKKYIEHSSAYQSSVTEEYEYSYDSQLRLTGVTHSLNGTSPVSLDSYAYNHLGQVETQATGGLETVAYAYNIRGWETSQTGSRFSENLYYTNNPKSGGQTYYGGNVASLTWKSPANNSTLRGYAFQYDALGRLQAAQYGEGGSLSANTQRYDEAFTYDKHGNPLTIKRYGRRDLYGDGSYGLIDDLTLPSYAGNYLLEVADAAGDLSHSDLMEFKDGFNNPGEEYVANCFGGLTSDYNKKICYMRYNYLALPQSVQFRYGHRIEYAYDAGGMKRMVKYKEANHDMGYWPWDDRVPAESDFLPSPLTKQYTSNKVYENNSLKLIRTENGYIEKTGGTYTRYYYLKDRLGNNRIVMNASGSVVQLTNYYPSGTVMAELPVRTDQGVQPYKFGDKELDRSNGLDFYDFVWRQYDSTLMRFTAPDPLAEKYYAISPYAYCMNNPVNAVDPDGRKVYFAPCVSQEFKNQFATAVQYLNEKGAAGMLAKLHASDGIYYIAEARRDASFDYEINTINWDPNIGLLTNEGIVISPTSVLNHEIDYALQYDTNKKQYLEDRRIKTTDGYSNLEEKRVITGSEQTTARKLGEVGTGKVTRTDHKGTYYETKGVKSTEGKNEITVTPNNKQNENTWNFNDWNNSNDWSNWGNWNNFMQW